MILEENAHAKLEETMLQGVFCLQDMQSPSVSHAYAFSQLCVARWPRHRYETWTTSRSTSQTALSVHEECLVSWKRYCFRKTKITKFTSGIYRQYIQKGATPSQTSRPLRITSFGYSARLIRSLPIYFILRVEISSGGIGKRKPYIGMRPVSSTHDESQITTAWGSSSCKVQILAC